MKQNYLLNYSNKYWNRYLRFLIITVVLFQLSSSCNNKQENFVKSFDNSLIEYSVAGNGKPALVFIHGGLGCNKYVWYKQTPYFQDKYKVVTLSLAGHGNSKSNRTDYTMESFGEDVAAVVNKLQLENVILVGHSLGGLVCIEAAKILQDKVVGIIGIDCLNEFELIWQDEFIQGFLNWFMPDTKEKVGNMIREMFTAETDSALVELTVNQFSSVDSSVFFNELDYWMHYQNEKFLNTVQKLEVPIACIHNGDNVLTVETNKKYNSEFTGVKMDSLLHFFIISYPELVNPEIENTIQNILRN